MKLIPNGLLAVCLGLVTAAGAAAQQRCHEGLAFGSGCSMGMLTYESVTEYRNAASFDYDLNFAARTERVRTGVTNGVDGAGFYASWSEYADGFEYREDDDPRLDYDVDSYRDLALGVDVRLMGIPRSAFGTSLETGFNVGIRATRLDIGDLNGGTRIDLAGPEAGLTLGLTQAIGARLLLNAGYSYQVTLQQARFRNQGDSSYRIQIADSHSLKLGLSVLLY